ncbi:hypothetical protein COL154_002904 [Colletotrichum chrysophilum]|uniref:Uncharacterized protein n=1 Tax=Colletotrichum chrysophilum TaxID=1836956 RepID=A0AAD9EEZ2_9PEZI|nr:uncharacterized protein COL26b_001485 [Colletotrichum chrysophilum]KAJ0353748.1 hypothetical protein KNSL1_001776 [Colletotrichum chrysophilum]KAJ0368153.1 hypothetical protein COL154_002904 [Colletotrichum chrysophilum]KAJ0380369.1 hypothetical protein COL26b_001485 [Colletotrichum chrysophilum]KAK1845823.1 hypothetical protein CCHR01_11555 [Colletotrichum chrysophilum]
MSPQNTFTFLLTLAAGAAAGRVQYRQVDCSTTTTLDALTVTRVEPISIYILPEQQQQQPTGTGADDEGFTAVYTTVYPTFAPECSEGLRAETYTITQTCSGSITQCHGYGDDLPPGFTTTQAVCNDGPTPVTAVLTVPQETDAVVTVTVEEVITEPGLTTTRLVTKTCANGPCLPDITAAAVPGADRLTINGGTIVLPVTVTKTETDKTTATEKETATVTTTSDSNEFNPNGFNSGAGHMIPSNKSMVFAMSAFALLFLLSA